MVRMVIIDDQKVSEAKVFAPSRRHLSWSRDECDTCGGVVYHCEFDR